jgi:CheY-like chemotaxis protein
MTNILKILLVEDEVVTAMMMQSQLKHCGYEISQHVTTGENAIISARKNPPDLILMDIRLAGEIDGIEAAYKIETESNIPLIFITGYDDRSIEERARKFNPLGYLTKPLILKKLTSIIESHFN